MTDDRIEGGMRKGFGAVQDAVGGLTGDFRTQADGKFNKAAGAAQDAVGQAKDRAQDAIDQARDRAQDVYEDVAAYAKDQPLAALAVTLGLGLVIGMVLRGGRKTVYVRK